MSFSKYPNKLDDSNTLPPATDNVTEVKAEVVNRIKDAVLAIEAELGTQPSSTYSTVKARLDDLRRALNDFEERLGSVEDDIIAGVGGGGGGSGGAPTPLDKILTPSVTSGDEASTGITVSFQTFGTSYLSVFINGVMATVGDGIKTEDCYFSDDGGITAKTIETIAKNDELFWNGNIAGFDLDGQDRVDFDYDV